MSESASGKASSSTDSNNKEFVCGSCGKSYSYKSDLTRHMRSCCPSELVTCPTCETGFYSRTGMRSHHAKSHGVSIAGDLHTCDYCGDEFRRCESASNTGKTGMYCSRRCSALATTKEGKEHRNYNSVIVECHSCGKEIERIKARVEKTDKQYCDNSCRTKEREVECDNCGKLTIKKNSHYQSAKNHFCSHACHDEFRRNGYEYYYGRSWREQRLKAIIRDQSRCQVCGITPVQTGKQLDVHHIVPLSKFKSLYNEPDCYEKAHKLHNLITLCSSHHRKWEGMPVIPERV